MEAGQRGFCITYHEEFLDPYVKGTQEFDVLLEEERLLVSRKLEQVAALDRTEQLVQQWQERAARPEIAMARKVAIQAVDEQMPVLYGYAATRRLREEGFQCPVIALTANAMNWDRERCLAAGCDDYAIKPIKRAELIGTSKRWTADDRSAVQKHSPDASVVS